MFTNLESNDGRALSQTIPPQPSSPAADPKPERFRLFALAALTAGLVGLCVLLAVPFLPAITWGVALAIMAWPMHRWIARHVERPVLASILSTLAVMIVILVPGFLVSYQLASEAASIADQMQSGGPGEVTIRDKMAESPALAKVAEWMDRMDIQIESEVRKFISAYLPDTAGVAQGSFSAVIQFLCAIFILYYLFLDRGTFLHGLRDVLPLSRSESDKVFTGAADSVHANLYATIITSLIDATGGGLMFWWLGLPSPLLWAVVIFILSILPVVGAGLIWFPATVYLAMTDRWLGASALLAWGIGSFIVVDNFIYVRLAGPRMRMHEVPALIAFLGGIEVFGLSGMILGPAILAVTMAVIDVWKRRILINTGNSLQPADGSIIVPSR